MDTQSMDNLVKALSVAASVVVIASGAHYLWTAHKADLEIKCHSDIVVRAARKLMEEGGTNAHYRDAMKMCIDRGYPL